MNSTENEAGDFEVEITPLQAPDGSGGQDTSLPPKILTALASSWRASSRRVPLMYAAIALSLVLLLAMVARSSFPLPASSTSAEQNAIPSLPPGYNSFYMQAAVPWMQVFIDGKHIEPPRPGIDVPLTLKPGHHLLSWQAEPFQAQSCRLSIPYAVSDTCNFAREEEITSPGSSTPLQIILLHESLLTLPTSQQSSLLQAIQASLANIPATQIIQPGEYYFLTYRSVVATQPLQARLRISLDMSSDNSCALDAEGMVPQPCTLAGQDCVQLCSVSWQLQQALALKQAATGWLAFARTHLTWDYSTLQGQSIASKQPIDNSPASYAPATDQLTLLNITWQKNRWQIHPLLGPDLPIPTVVDSGDLGQPAGASIQLADDPGCIAAEDVFAQLIAYSDTPLNNATQQVRYLSGPNPAAGCLVVVPSIDNTANGSTSWQTALFLERFGVTLAVNDAAHHLLPDLPLVDSSEQALARQLSTLTPITGWDSSFSPGGNSR